MKSWFDEPESVIRKIQDCDDDLRNEFILDGFPFVKGVVFRLTRDFNAEKSDDFSIALQAFNRAINRFDTEKGIPFEPYARIIIRNAVLNHIRSEKRAHRPILMTDTQNDQGEEVMWNMAGDDGSEIQRDLEFEEAMAETESKLQLFGLTLKQISERIPRHADTRRLCVMLARLLIRSKMDGEMMKTKKLPVKTLSMTSGVPIKTIERHRAAILYYEAILSCGPESVRYYAKAFEEERK